jgi:hypothetical protein
MESPTYDPRIDTGAPRVDTTTETRQQTAYTRPRETRTVGTLFAELLRETTTLVHEEAELAKADLNEKVNQITTGAGSIAAGGAVLFAGFIVLLIAASNALAMVLPIELAPWLAPLIVALVVMLIGFAMYAGGKKKLEVRNLKPSRSMESLRRDGRLVKEHAK